MATTFEAKSYATPAVSLTAQPSPIFRLSKAESFTLTASSNDVIKFFKLPVNAKILNAGFVSAALGASGTLDLIISNGTTTKVVLNEVVASAAACVDARVMHQTGLAGSVVGEATVTDWFGFVTNDDNYYVAIRVGDTQIGTPAAGNVQCFVEYTMALEGREAT